MSSGKTPKVHVNRYAQHSKATQVAQNIQAKDRPLWQEVAEQAARDAVVLVGGLTGRKTSEGDDLLGASLGQLAYCRAGPYVSQRD